MRAGEEELPYSQKKQGSYSQKNRGSVRFVVWFVEGVVSLLRPLPIATLYEKLAQRLSHRCLGLWGLCACVWETCVCVCVCVYEGQL